MHHFKQFLSLFLSILVMVGFLGGCKKAKEAVLGLAIKAAGKEGEKVVDLARRLADPRLHGPVHQRLRWKAEDFFTDPDVIALCKAIEAKDLDRIDRLVESGGDINARGRGNMTPLFWAFPMGEEVFTKMLELGADPNVQLTENYLCLRSKSFLCAALRLAEGPMHNQYFHDVPMDNYLKLVLEHGGNPNQEDMDGQTPLFDVTPPVLKPAEKIKMLLDAGADINHQDHQGFTAATHAGSCYGSLLALLKAGADYRIPNEWGFDVILQLERNRQLRIERNTPLDDAWEAAAQPVRDWLTKEGANWEAARAVCNDPEMFKKALQLPGDYKHRPWLPQRPTFRKPD